VNQDHQKCQEGIEDESQREQHRKLILNNESVHITDLSGFTPPEWSSFR
jgi:hypothetical protein